MGFRGLNGEKSELRQVVIPMEQKNNARQKIRIICEHDLIARSIAENIALVKFKDIDIENIRLQDLADIQDNFDINVVDFLVIASEIQGRLGQMDDLYKKLCFAARVVINLSSSDVIPGAIFLPQPFSFAYFWKIILRHIENLGLFCCIGANWIYNENAASLSMYDGHQINLTDKENNIFKQLLIAPNHLIDKESLGLAVWKHNILTESNTIETHLYKLKQKLPEGMLSVFSVCCKLNITNSVKCC